MLEYRGLRFFSSFHHHNIRPHLDVILVLIWIVYIVNDSVYCNFRLLLSYFGVIAYDTLTLIRVPKTIIYNSVRYAEFRGELGKGFSGGIINYLLVYL